MLHRTTSPGPNVFNKKQKKTVSLSCIKFQNSKEKWLTLQILFHSSFDGQGQAGTIFQKKSKRKAERQMN
jgi:hypothetical protein